MYVSQHGPGRFQQSRVTHTICRLGPTHQTLIKHYEIHEIAESKLSVELAILPNRQPLVVGLDCSGLSIFIAAFVFLMILSTVLVGIIADLVIIPNRNERVRTMGSHQVLVEAILSVAIPVVLECDNLMIRYIESASR